MAKGKLTGDATIHPDAILQMIASDLNFKTTRWAVYQNHDLGHPDVGQLLFLAVGPDNTIPEAPERMPDTKHGLGWRYLHVGFVDTGKGEIVAE